MALSLLAFGCAAEAGPDGSPAPATGQVAQADSPDAPLPAPGDVRDRLYYGNPVTRVLSLDHSADNLVFAAKAGGAVSLWLSAIEANGGTVESTPLSAKVYVRLPDDRGVPSWHFVGRHVAEHATLKIEERAAVSSNYLVQLEAPAGTRVLASLTCDGGNRNCEIGLQPGEACRVSAGGCDVGLRCNRADYACGDEGACHHDTQVCTMDYSPVCGCDGRTYSNACAAAKVGVSYRRECDHACPWRAGGSDADTLAGTTWKTPDGAYEYIFNGDGTFVSYHFPCVGLRSPLICLLVIPPRKGVWTADGPEIDISYDDGRFVVARAEADCRGAQRIVAADYDKGLELLPARP